MEKAWYVVHTYSGFENKVRLNLLESIKNEGVEDLFEEILIPSETVVELKKGEKKTSSRKFFPGYILVKMVLTDETWHIVKETSKVTGFVGGNNPVAIPDEEVTKITRRMEEGARGALIEEWLPEQDRGEAERLLDQFRSQPGLTFLESVFHLQNRQGEIVSCAWFSTRARQTGLRGTAFWTFGFPAPESQTTRDQSLHRMHRRDVVVPRRQVHDQPGAVLRASAEDRLPRGGDRHVRVAQQVPAVRPEDHPQRIQLRERLALLDADAGAVVPDALVLLHRDGQLDVRGEGPSRRQADDRSGEQRTTGPSHGWHPPFALVAAAPRTIPHPARHSQGTRMKRAIVSTCAVWGKRSTGRTSSMR